MVKLINFKDKDIITVKGEHLKVDSVEVAERLEDIESVSGDGTTFPRYRIISYNIELKGDDTEIKLSNKCTGMVIIKLKPKNKHKVFREAK